MLKQGSGTISLVSSVAGYRGLPKSLIYGPTKAALINLAETMYLDLQPRGVAVSVINPGFVKTPLTAQNEFEMPNIITPEEAADEIVKGLSAGEFEIHFPKAFSRKLKLRACCPTACISTPSGNRPKRTQFANPVNMDRPYAGFDYGSFSISRLKGLSIVSSLEFELGLVGEATGLGALQEWWHTQAGFEKPSGWDTQIANEVTFNLNYQFQKNFNVLKDIDLVSTSGVFVGTGSNKIAQDITIRMIDFNPITGSVFSNNRLAINGNQDKEEVFLFAGIGIDYVISNIFLEGRLFNNNQSFFTVEATPWVFRTNAKLQYGIRGLDFNTTADSYNYGSNIYIDYDQDRYADTNVKTGQGNTTNVLIADLQAGYLINPQTNLKLFGNLLLRNLSPKEETDAIKKGTTTWFFVGIRCDIFILVF